MQSIILNFIKDYAKVGYILEWLSEPYPTSSFNFALNLSMHSSNVYIYKCMLRYLISKVIGHPCRFSNVRRRHSHKNYCQRAFEWRIKRELVKGSLDGTHQPSGNNELFKHYVLERVRIIPTFSYSCFRVCFGFSRWYCIAF